ncbi:MAG: alpha/beta fold hydrolase [Planctomycetota bacterium]|nr:MAG: alpha/beta fold hydrolase [Planctomycetota bacterium]
MKTLRTPDARFENLADWPYEPHYVEVPGGLRMHYVEAGQGDPILCVHGEPTWAYLYRKMIPALSKQGRVVAVDLVGFGRSDKPVGRKTYTYKLHHDALAAFIEELDLKNITLVCQDWGGLLGLPIAVEQPERFARLVVMNTGLPVSGKPFGPAFMAWRAFAEKSTDMDIGRLIQQATVSDLSDEVLAAYNAPFPDVSYKDGALEFPLLVPVSEDAEALPAMRAAADGLSKWTKPALVMFSDKDPITAGGDKYFRQLIPTAKDEPEITIQDGGHFLQEDQGEVIAEHIVEFIKRRPIK